MTVFLYNLLTEEQNVQQKEEHKNFTGQKVPVISEQQTNPTPANHKLIGVPQVIACLNVYFQKKNPHWLSAKGKKKFYLKRSTVS